uniref:Uncharacterized protein n=1 Tax=Arundo donax TaxID=35708 RepID=A0A0A8XZB3_ARUDO
MKIFVLFKLQSVAVSHCATTM